MNNPALPSNKAAAIRWNLVVSYDIDQALRQFLVSQGGGRKVDLSRFVEEAVKARILELAAAQAQQQNAGLSAEAVDQAIDEALNWTRQG
ncbi:MAG: methionine repressor-like protein [Methylococcaceae bacterium]|nr:MAG: methionine repressor-like protein [Methylococcaceae bacterium]